MTRHSVAFSGTSVKHCWKTTYDRGASISVQSSVRDRKRKQHQKNVFNIPDLHMKYIYIYIISTDIIYSSLIVGEILFGYVII